LLDLEKEGLLEAVKDIKKMFIRNENSAYKEKYLKVSKCE
jgi:hypothetical protein